MCVCLQWKKHWFVLTDAGLKYYRDSGAEEVGDHTLKHWLVLQAGL